MHLHRIVSSLMCLMIMVVLWSCTKSNQLASTTIYEANAQISVAKQGNAAELASDQLTEAENYLTKAQKALKSDDSQEAYRLAKRAYLKAKYAEALAKRNKAERMADVEEAELEKLLREVDRARRTQEAAEKKLEKLSK